MSLIERDAALTLHICRKPSCIRYGHDDAGNCRAWGHTEAEEWVPAEHLQGAVEALRWIADRYAQTLAGKSVRDADEALERARLVLQQHGGQ